MTTDQTFARARLYFDDPPQIDFAALTTAIHKRAARFGVPCDLEWMPGGTTEHRLLLGGGGQHAVIEYLPVPRPAASFSQALQSAVTKAKRYDFQAAIASHTAHVTIEVGDGDLPCQSLLRPDLTRRATLLHLLAQTVAETATPTMAEFGPAGALLSPKDLQATAGLALPIPHLFHPRITLAGASVRDKPLWRVTAEASHALIGRTLILDRVPSDMKPAEMINILSSLIESHLAGDLPLADGDEIDLDNACRLYTSRPSSGTIFASFERPARPQPTQRLESHATPRTLARPPKRRAHTLAYILMSALALGAALNADVRPALTEPGPQKASEHSARLTQLAPKVQRASEL